MDQALLRLRRGKHLDDDLHRAVLRIQEREVLLQVSKLLRPFLIRKFTLNCWLLPEKKGKNIMGILLFRLQ